MCVQLIELYSACRCLYYTHSIDRCAAFGRPPRGCPVQKRTILVGYLCSSHSIPHTSLDTADENAGVDEDQESDEGDGASVLSDVSAPSTSFTLPDDAKQEARDRLFQELLNDFSLRHLWPQIVRISFGRDRAVKVIARYLARFSRDLRTRATGRQNKDAADFVGTSRLTVADRIVECHINEISDKGELISDIRKIETPQDGLVEDDEDDEDDETEDPDKEERNIVYEQVQHFIFEGAPFQSFVSALKLFVSNDTEPNYDLVTIMRQSRCGQHGHDDYHERRPGAIEELQILLKDYKKMNLELVENTGSTTPRTGTANLFSIIKNTFSLPSLKGKSTKLPTFNKGSPGQSFGEACQLSSSIQASALDPKHKFLMVCAPLAKRASKAHQPDVCKIHSDRDFFKALRYTYYNSRYGLKWRWFRSVSSIDFVKFEIFLSELVNVQQCPSLPASQARTEYDFEQCDTDPPVGPNLLLHLFENPEHAEVLPVLFNRIPKKLGKRLCACPRKGSSVGWGIRFVEGLDPLAVFLCGCAGFVVSLAVSLVYTLVMDDIQGGFAIGAHMLAFFLFSGGCLHSTYR
ncbi:transcription factor c2h2 [Fusarium longipes]|uniref:Transcription factor c2h2 n=1 Tax=Fusarium longipes TaxID=694270 RepID=A0A395T3G5_9HYPO|nr:transcription factor c2h2 [Fusarium longipes]